MLASIGGAAFGVPWLGALGMGMQGANAMLNGDSSMSTAQAATGAMNTVVNGLKDVWKNPSEGNIAKTEQQQAEEKLAKAVGNAGGGNVDGSTSAGTTSAGILPSNDGKNWTWTEPGGFIGKPYNLWEDINFWNNIGHSMRGVWM